MKKTAILSFFFFAIAVSSCLNAQTPTTAKDFTLVDCDGTEHNLFSELDSGNVVLMSLMMDCPSCVNIRKKLPSISAAFAQSHPGKLRIYSMARVDEYTCQQMLNWQNAIHPSFAGTKFLVDYYDLGATAMPLVVVVGGKDHKIFYSKDGFSAKDTTAIKNAIAEAFAATASVGNEMRTISASIYPNPSATSSTLSVSCNTQSTVEISLFNAVGEQVESIYSGSLALGTHEFDVTTAKLSSGTYYVHVMNNGKKEILPITVTR